MVVLDELQLHTVPEEAGGERDVAAARGIGAGAADGTVDVAARGGGVEGGNGGSGGGDTLGAASAKRRRTGVNNNVFYHAHTRMQRAALLQPPSRYRHDFCKLPFIVQTLQRTVTLEGHSGCVNAIAFNPSGSLVVSGSDDSLVKIWDVYSGECLRTMGGHVSNVFTTAFVPHKNDEEVLSGGNDSDIRHYNMAAGVCTVFEHHRRKVLRVCVNPLSPTVFLSCSGDGTVRQFDLRVAYGNTRTEAIQSPDDAAGNGIRGAAGGDVVPQAWGGGRSGRSGFDPGTRDSLILDYKLSPINRRRQTSLFCCDWHPSGHTFCVASEDCFLRIFDVRMIHHQRMESAVARFRPEQLGGDWENGGLFPTGCRYSANGSEIVASYIGDQVYVFNVADGCAAPLLEPSKDGRGWEDDKSDSNSGNGDDGYDDSVSEGDIVFASDGELGGGGGGGDDGSSAMKEEPAAKAASTTTTTAAAVAAAEVATTATPMEDGEAHTTAGTAESGAANDNAGGSGSGSGSGSDSESDGTEQVGAVADEMYDAVLESGATGRVNERGEIFYRMRPELFGIDPASLESDGGGGDAESMPSNPFDSDVPGDGNGNGNGNDGVAGTDGGEGIASTAMEMEPSLPPAGNGNGNDGGGNNQGTRNSGGLRGNNEGGGANGDGDDNNDDGDDDDDLPPLPPLNAEEMAAALAAEEELEGAMGGDRISMRRGRDGQWYMVITPARRAEVASDPTSVADVAASSAFMPQRDVVGAVRQYRGHVSISTIKGVNFYGPDSEYVVSGSDDGGVFIWDKCTGELLNVLQGHSEVVNSVEVHPFDACICTAGIDSEALIWDAKGGFPNTRSMQARRKRIKGVVERSQAAYQRVGGGGGGDGGGECTIM